MIAHVSGLVSEKFNNSIVIDVDGIGYEVQVAREDYDSALLGESIKLHTYHHVREQSQELFGFSSLMAKKLFELLITVQGVGPKAALAILSLGSSDSVRNAIANADAVFVAKASGVGKKTAERVTVDLSDKVGLPVDVAVPQSVAPSGQLVHDDALEALMSLGYTLADASEALRDIDVSLPTSDRVREALKS